MLSNTFITLSQRPLLQPSRVIYSSCLFPSCTPFFHRGYSRRQRNAGVILGGADYTYRFKSLVKTNGYFHYDHFSWGIARNSEVANNIGWRAWIMKLSERFNNQRVDRTPIKRVHWSSVSGTLLFVGILGAQSQSCCRNMIRIDTEEIEYIHLVDRSAPFRSQASLYPSPLPPSPTSLTQPPQLLRQLHNTYINCYIWRRDRLEYFSSEIFPRLDWQRT